MRHSILILLVISSLSFAQEEITAVRDASENPAEPGNPTLLHSKELAAPATVSSHRQTDLNLLRERAKVSTVTPLGNGNCDGFSCPDASIAACLDSADKVCSGSAKCVDKSATCFDGYPCNSSEGFVCASQYNDTLGDLREAVKLHEELALENVTLRERRLQQKNCVLNSQTLSDAQSCVRKP